LLKVKLGDGLFCLQDVAEVLSYLLSALGTSNPDLLPNFTTELLYSYTCEFGHICSSFLTT